MLIRKCVVLILVTLCLCEKTTYKRKIDKKLIPVKCANVTYTLIHITATSELNKNDVIHYIVAAIDKPTIVVKHVMALTQLNLTNENICQRNGSGINFWPDPTGEINGAIITKVFPYDDKKDTVSLADAETVGKDIMANFTWKFNADGSFSAVSPVLKGSLDFMVETHTKPGHSAILPHNPVHANVSEFTFTMQGLPTNTFQHTRYAVEVAFFATAGKEEGEFNTHRSIDDEYTPGIFTMWSITFPVSFKQMFAAWKPVAYNHETRSHTNQCLLYNFNNNHKKLPKQGSLPSATTHMGWSLVEGVSKISFYTVDITFGLSKDGWFISSKYMSWTGMVGFDRPPQDSISQTVIIVMSVGLGAPVVVILIGVFVLMVRKVRFSERSAYEEIN